MSRLFVALWPSPAAIAATAADLDRIRLRHPDLRWQGQERWHVTLAFLGQVDVERTTVRLDRLLAEPPPAGGLQLAGAGTFGPVVWLGVQHGAWLTVLARRLQHELRTEDKRFRAHMTVARGRGAQARTSAAAAVPDLAGHQSPAWLPRDVTLVASVTGPSPRYTVLQRWPLAGHDRLTDTV